MVVAGMASGATAQRRAALPAWQPGLDVDALAAGAGVTLPARTRVTLSGTVTSMVDGERYDAFHRVTDEGGQRASLVVLPLGARVVEEDYEAHTYVVELGAARALRIDPAVIAVRSLHTVSEVRDGLRGAIVVDVAYDPAAADAAVAAASADAAAPPLSNAAIAGYGALAATPPMLLLALFGAFRRRRRPERVLLSRIRRAADAIDREAIRLGPAFGPLQDAADEARREGARLHRAHRDVEGARRRLSSITRTDRGRLVELDVTERRALLELGVLADRLEETAVSLASHDARLANAGDVDAALHVLGDELRTAISADLEARRVA
jgi:hypothetical protein